jgi:Transglycosylase SLT domain
MSLAPFTAHPATNRAGPPPAVRAAIQAATARTGVDSAYLTATAAIESSFKTDAKAATSSATGLYQFTDGTWLDIVKAHGAKHGLARFSSAIEAGKLDSQTRQEILGLRTDPKLSAGLAAELTRDNQRHLAQSVGGDLGSADLYLAHFLGRSGAERFIQAARANATQAAAPLFPEAANANRSVFYEGTRARSLAEIYQRVASKIGAEAPAAAPAPSTAPTMLAQAPALTRYQAEPPATYGATVSRPLLHSHLQTQLLLAALRPPGEAEEPA